MAEAVLKPLDTLTCPICLDLLKVPVTIHCGHSFCEGCIKDCWDQEDQRGVYSCPQCRHTFTPRPVLNKNTMLAELAKALRTTRPQAPPPAGSGDVECDVCIGAKHKAVKSCLVCLASYCETHIQPHYQSPALKKHKLVDASVNLQGKICSLHDKLLEVFCRTDQKCICYLCVMDEHSGHKTVSAAAARSGKQNQLVETQGKLQLRIQQTENKVQEMRQAMDTLRSSAQTAVEDSKRLFTELIESIERRRSEVKKQIRAQEKAELSAAEDVLEKLEQEMADLRRRYTKLEQLSHTEDHIHFLQSFQSLSAPPQTADLPHVTLSAQFSLEDLKTAVTGAMERVKAGAVRFSRDAIQSTLHRTHSIQHLTHKHWREAAAKRTQRSLDQEQPSTWRTALGTRGFTQDRDNGGILCRHRENMETLPRGISREPKSREDFLKYSCHLTLDPNTSNGYLDLFESNRKLTVTLPPQKYPYHPERFEEVPQVLCRETLSGRCYWEVEFKCSDVDIAICYKDISRKGEGKESRFGNNDQSWSLIPSGSSFRFSHNNKHTILPVKSSSSRIGVYVDTSAGILSFYSVSDTMTLLHRVHTSFTQPLCAGFGVRKYGSVLKICDLN